jgi:Mg-chelatase subunit ChlD
MKRNARIAAGAVVLSVAGLLLWKSQAGARGPDAKTSIPVAASPNDNRPKVDIVFALDTTGSMGGLIEGAKAKIWEIARKAQEGQPAPEVRIGLVAYRDRGDDYITQVVPLTSDLDAIYAKLSAFRAGGGGDGPEHVLRGLDEAISSQWSTDARAVKLVYLVGDAPPHFDYQDGITLDTVLTKAQKAGVRVSAIRCGNDHATLTAWTNIAQKTDGEVASIEQQGGVVAVRTPFDDELARLNAELARTEVHFGSDAEQESARQDLAKNVAAPAAAQADRAGFYATRAKGGSGSATKKDLTAGGATSLAAVKEAELPPEMKSMTPEERATFVEGKKKEREAVLAKISDLNSKRTSHLKSAPAPKASAFDGKVIDSLKKAGAKSGIAY